MALTLVAVSACDAGGASTLTKANTPQPSHATATATPTLPTLSADTGWKTVLQLGYVSPGVTTSGGAFNASGPFTVIVVCEGARSLDIEYLPLGGSGYTCGATQQLNRNQIGSVQGLPADGLVHVTVTADSGVEWRALIEEQS